MQDSHISEAPSEVQALDAAIADAWQQTGLDRQAMLESLNEQGWSLVRAEDLDTRVKFTREERDTIIGWATDARESDVEELQHCINDGNWAELSIPSNRIRVSEGIREKLGFQ